MLQTEVIIAEPIHSNPPCAALTFLSLVMVTSPPPHGLEHSPITQSSHSQFTCNKNSFVISSNFTLTVELFIKRIIFLPGHSSTLQLSVMMESPEQFFPPWAASTIFFLVTYFTPPPHVVEHLPVFHLSHSQSTSYEMEKELYRLCNN